MQTTMTEQIVAPAAVSSKTHTLLAYLLVKSLGGGAFRVYDNRMKEYVGNAMGTEGACRQIIRNMKKD